MTEVLYMQYAVRHPAGHIVVERIIAMNGDAFEEFTYETAKSFADAVGGEVLSRQVCAPAWDDAQTAVDPNPRDPRRASAKQEDFIEGLLAGRDVPDALRKQVGTRPWSKEDAQRFIPMLRDTPRVEYEYAYEYDDING